MRTSAVPTELRDEVLKRVARANESAFRVRRKDFFMGRWLKHAQLYPTWFVRLFRPSHIRYERLVNPVAIVDGPIGELESHIIHYPFSHGVSHWIARHNRYSDMEAIEAAKVGRSNAAAAQQAASIWSSDPNERRRVLKDIFFKLACTPVPEVRVLLWLAARLPRWAGRTDLCDAASDL